MLRTSGVVVVSVYLLMHGLGCTSHKPVQPTWDDLPYVQIVDGSPSDWKLDSFQLEGLAVDGDSVRVTVTYGGGCEAHTFALFMPPGIIKTNPPQVELYLRHNGHGDLCKEGGSLITETVAFDIAPIQELFATHYGGTQDVVLDLYRFGQDDYVQAVYPGE